MYCVMVKGHDKLNQTNFTTYDYFHFKGLSFWIYIFQNLKKGYEVDYVCTNEIF
jgi:hypothetical protein